METVDGVQIRARAGFDHVRAGAFAGDQIFIAAAKIHLHRHFAQRVLALRDGAQRVIHQLPLRAGQPVDRLQGGIDRAVADAGVLHANGAILAGASFCRRTVAVGTVRLPLVTPR
jgi:hypothetical protein